jgi:phosphoketolase
MKSSIESHEEHRIRERASLYRKQSPVFAEWAAGYGVIEHDDLTQVRVYEMADLLTQRGVVSKKEEVYRILAAADRIANAAMWLVVHMTYARNVYLDGRDLEAEDFKTHPEGHTGGSLNMVLAYVGYLAANAITRITRAWLMGQGHCVAAIDATNLIVNNMTPAHAERYDLSDAGLSRFVRDFYSYKVRPDGRPESPLGSHVNVNTAGGLMEGGYLGFAELQYVHMPLPGERLVAFLSDGAFEEQRGSDWVPRWWRSEDSGLVCPIMIANGRRIDQRTTMSQQGGVEWFREHLRLNGFDPIDIDGRDPAAYAWVIFEIEERLTACAHAVAAGKGTYPVPMHYAIAEVPKGYGFPGAGTNLAHGLPLGANPSEDAEARSLFNTGARRLWVPLEELEECISVLNNHESSQRVRERDHALIRRKVPSPELPDPPWRSLSKGVSASPMEGVDKYFTDIVRANPNLRPRVGNPDEMRSNRMNTTLDLLRHRVTAPESGVAEAVDGAVITALNEEAVVCAALANKGGINIVVTYEAFGVKMLGAIRQEIIFTRHQREAGLNPNWLGVPIILTSHTWENGKNEQSHQDPTLCEALMGEMSDVSRVLFPADWNTAVASLRAAYSARGEIWTLVIPKQEVPDYFTPAQAQELIEVGALRLRGSGSKDEHVLLASVGSYQLSEALRASDRLSEKGFSHSVVYLLEPTRFRNPRDSREAMYMAASEQRESLFPSAASVRVFLTHTRPEPLIGVTRPLDTGMGKTKVLGYISHGGTLNVPGMLFANRCTWAHALAAVAEALDLPPTKLLSAQELKAIRGEADPASILF